MGWLELIGCHLLVFCINLIVPGFVIYYFNRANHKLMYVFSLFWPKKVHFKANIYNFLTFMLINFLMRTLQCTKSVVLFRPWKYETTTLKSRIYLQNCRTFSYCWPAQNQPNSYILFHQRLLTVSWVINGWWHRNRLKYGFRLLSCTTLVEQKSKQTAIDDRPKLKSAPFNDPAYANLIARKLYQNNFNSRRTYFLSVKT